jgi:solute carrier family 36 (proton-coupled amino acid transporter)
MVAGIFLTFGYLIPNLPPLADRTYAASPDRLAFFFGIALFAFEGIALVLPLKNAMKVPRNFSKVTGVLNVSMVIASTVYVAIGILGYWRYGEDTLGSITLNLEKTDV